MKKGKAVPGMRVRLTGDFLRSTVQVAGGEGASRWTVVECGCPMCGRDGAFCAVNEPHLCQSDPTGYEDIPESMRPKWRHFNVGNLEACK